MIFLLASVLIFSVSTTAMNNEEENRFTPRINEVKRQIFELRQKHEAITPSTVEQTRAILRGELLSCEEDIFCFKLYLAERQIFLNADSPPDDISKAYKEYYQKKIYDSIKMLYVTVNLASIDHKSDIIMSLIDELKAIKNSTNPQSILLHNSFVTYIKNRYNVDYNNSKTQEEINIAIKRNDLPWVSFLKQNFQVYIEKQIKSLESLEMKIFEMPLEANFQKEVNGYIADIKADMLNMKKLD